MTSLVAPGHDTENDSSNPPTTEPTTSSTDTTSTSTPHPPPPSTQNQRAAQFLSSTLSHSQLDSNPFRQFHAWFSDPRLKSQVPETCCLSTAELPTGRVSARYVYLKELDERGFVVYSNWGTSRKGESLLLFRGGEGGMLLLLLTDPTS